MRRAFAPALLATLLFAQWLLASHAVAHDQPYTFLDLRLEPTRLEGALTAHVFDLAHEIGLASPDTLLAGALAAGRADTLRALFAGRLILIADGDTLRPRWTSIVPDPKRNGLRFAFAATLSRLPGALAIEARLFPYDRQHETYLNVHQDGALRLQDLLGGERRTATFYSGTRQGVAAVVGTFVRSGIHHIFIGPDHILFVVGLMLLGGGIGRLIKIVTAFTVAHSVTLALATLGILDPPARIIEPLIALSIVYVGVDTLRARRGGRDARALIAIGFGLIHGFGFAGVLREFGLPQQALGWSLFAFNLGVELGQATIVLLVAPVLSLARARAPSIHARIVTVGSWAVSLAGLYWLVERLFFAGP